MDIRLKTATASAQRPSLPHAIIAELYVYALGVTPAAWPIEVGKVYRGEKEEERGRARGRGVRKGYKWCPGGASGCQERVQTVSERHFGVS